MDKMPDAATIWGINLFLGVAGFFLARVNPVFLLLVLPLVWAFGWLNFSEINDPLIGEHILREAGDGYLVQNYLAVFAGTALPLAGVGAWWARRRTKPLV